MAGQHPERLEQVAPDDILPTTEAGNTPNSCPGAGREYMLVWRDQSALHRLSPAD